MPVCLSSLLNLKSILESNMEGLFAVFWRIYIKSLSSVLILVYFTFKSFSSLFWMPATAFSIYPPLTSDSSSSISSGTPANNFCIRVTKLLYYSSLLLISSSANNSWSFFPVLSSIWSNTLIKIALMLLRILPKDSLTYF